MSIKRIYHCNICKREQKELESKRILLSGFNVKPDFNIEIVGWSTTENHICDNCASGLSEVLIKR